MATIIAEYYLDELVDWDKLNDFYKKYIDDIKYDCYNFLSGTLKKRND